MNLTERKIEKLATTERGREDRLVFDDEQRGLAVRITASGGRTYLCQYTLHRHDTSTGACSAVRWGARQRRRQSWVTWRRGKIQRPSEKTGGGRRA